MQPKLASTARSQAHPRADLNRVFLKFLEHVQLFAITERLSSFLRMAMRSLQIWGLLEARPIPILKLEQEGSCEKKT